MTRLLVRKSERTYRLNETVGFSFGNDAARQRIQRKTYPLDKIRNYLYNNTAINSYAIDSGMLFWKEILPWQ